MPCIDGALLSAVHRGDHYQCGHFVRDAWAHLTGDTLPASINGFLLPAADRSVLQTLRHDFEHVLTPTGGPLICVFRKIRGRVHVGMMWKRKVLELTDQGASYLPLSTVMMRFNAVQFYRPRA